ncbi:hypothetical protein CYMTET_25089 [Cymbomonas tetramitiformis]|uniref:Uncharacterized protein n=1 Tax=Cymbomonas tetramitiformis TaxID=36881 RepID=A0AAE0FUH6_9CHLO|nr:hypothetical protein CYMTET_25089 [Cymbomonas tetramitiformis]
MEEKVYNNSDGFTSEPIFNRWLQEFETSQQRAVMNTTAKQATRGGAGGGGGRFQGRERHNHGVEARTRRTHRISLPTDAVRAHTGLAVGLAPGVNVLGTILPGSNFPFRDWAEGGADSIGESAAKEGSLARGFQKYMKFDVQGELYQCSALPFGWNDLSRSCQVHEGPGGGATVTDSDQRLVEIAYDDDATTSGENNWINQPWGLLDEVAHKLGEEGAGGMVVAPYRPGQSWFWVLEEIAEETVMLPRRRYLFAPSRLGGSELLGASSWDAIMFRILYKGTMTDVAGTGQYHIQYDDEDEEWLQLSEELTRPERLEAEENNDVAPVDEWTSALRECWREETVRLYLAMLLDRGGIRATSLQPYLSAINNYHEDMGWPGPAKGRSVSRAVKGMARLQVAASEATGVTVAERTWLPAKHVGTVHEAALTLEPEDRDHIRWLQAYTYVMLAFVSFGRPDTGTSLQQENVLMDEDGVTVALTREKVKNHKLKKRQLSILWWGVERLRELLELWTRCRDEA